MKPISISAFAQPSSLGPVRTDHNLLFRSIVLATVCLAAVVIMYLPKAQRAEDCSGLLSCGTGFANSQFATAIIGSFAGALAGAWIAQRIAERNKIRDELLKEIRNTNAAVALAYTTVNSSIVIKKQHIADLKAKQDAIRRSYEEVTARQESRTFAVDFDFRTLPDAVPPMQALQDIVFERISITGRPLHLVATLVQTFDGLNLAIRKRNQLMEEYKADGFDAATLLNLVLGNPLTSGRTDRTYPDLVEGIYDQTDWVIGFGKLLCDDLSDHGEGKAREYQQLFGKELPKVQRVSFANAEKMGLMPDPKTVDDLIAAFPSSRKASEA